MDKNSATHKNLGQCCLTELSVMMEMVIKCLKYGYCDLGDECIILFNFCSINIYLNIKSCMDLVLLDNIDLKGGGPHLVSI